MCCWSVAVSVRTVCSGDEDVSFACFGESYKQKKMFVCGVMQGCWFPASCLTLIRSTVDSLFIVNHQKKVSGELLLSRSAGGSLRVVRNTKTLQQSVETRTVALPSVTDEQMVGVLHLRDAEMTS